MLRLKQFTYHHVDDLYQGLFQLTYWLISRTKHLFCLPLKNLSFFFWEFDKDKPFVNMTVMAHADEAVLSKRFEDFYSLYTGFNRFFLCSSFDKIFHHTHDYEWWEKASVTTVCGKSCISNLIILNFMPAYPKECGLATQKKILFFHIEFVVLARCGCYL